MVDSGLRIAIDPLFPPPNLNSKRMNITNIPITMWELVFDKEIDGPELDLLYDKYDKSKGEGDEKKREKDLEDELIKEED